MYAIVPPQTFCLNSIQDRNYFEFVVFKFCVLLLVIGHRLKSLRTSTCSIGLTIIIRSLLKFYLLNDCQGIYNNSFL